MMRVVRDVVPFPRSLMADPLAFGAAFPGTTVLIIDPNENDRRYYAKGLRSSSTDYLVLEAGDGRSGLEVHRTHRIDCVILELVLPDVDALEILASMVPIASRPTVAVVALAQWSSPSLYDIAMQKGVQACLIKSETSRDVLEQTIQKAMSAVFSYRNKTASDYLPLN
jgi:DNA-binding NarL/FixJ family response regulator